MKAKGNLLAGIILGILVGWILGFLRLPYVEKNSSFLVGFIAGLVFVSLVVILLFLWNKKGNASFPNSRIVITGFIVLGVLVSGAIIYRKNKLLNDQVQEQNKKVEEMSKIMESVRKNDQAVLVSSIMEKVEDEAKNNPARTLSDETIARIIAAANYSLKPYRYWEEDSLSKIELSPERGQLLIGLKAMNIDSSSFSKIKLNASFSGADLKGADLKGMDLSRADLKKADFKDADLSGVNFSEVNLSGANLWGANLNDAKLNRADLKRANLNWTKLNRADLKSTNLDGANLTSAQLINADLRGATLRWAELNGALFNEAKLEGVDFIGANLTRANLSSANLSGGNLGKSNLSEANLTGAELTKTSIEEEKWLEKLNEWRVIGMKEINEGYKIASDSTGKYKESKYRLEKNEALHLNHTYHSSLSAFCVKI